MKILSRITEPSAGRVTIRGRVASLLEVGTGFHPELTGRENIFLNGAILGMTRAEIRRKFDEIVAFAEVEQFLDTPVKRYSSGMYVRLAFAVATHLDPEILLVDEVLAVGDAEFQKKCLGRMNDVSRRNGKTALLVSHNMEVVLKLCDRAIVLDAGQVASIGDASDVLPTYLAGRISLRPQINLRNLPRASEHFRKACITQVAPAEQKHWVFPFGEPVALDIWIEAQRAIDDIELAIGLFSARGFEVASWTNRCRNQRLSLQAGQNIFRVEYEEMRLLPGQYSFGIGLRSDRGFEDYVSEAAIFEVTPSALSAQFNTQTFHGVVVPTARVVLLSRPQSDAISLGAAGS